MALIFIRLVKSNINDNVIGKRNSTQNSFKVRDKFYLKPQIVLCVIVVNKSTALFTFYNIMLCLFKLNIIAAFLCDNSNFHFDRVSSSVHK